MYVCVYPGNIGALCCICLPPLVVPPHLPVWGLVTLATFYLQPLHLCRLCLLQPAHA